MVVIRHAEPADIPALWLCLQSRADNAEAFAERARSVLRSRQHCLPIAVEGKDVVGYAWAQDYGPHLRDGEHSARLHDLFVSESARRQGVGSRLFEAVRSWAQASGARELQWQSNERALGFYARLGLKGDPCPQPDYPFFEIEFPDHE